MGDEVLVHRVSTSVVAARDRFDFWEQSMASLVYPVRLRPVDHRDRMRETTDFRAEFVRVDAGAATLSSGLLDPVRSETTTEHAGQRSGEVVHIGFHDGGRLLLESRQGKQNFTGGSLMVQADDEPHAHTFLERVPMVLLSVRAARLSLPVEALRSSMFLPLQADPALRSLMLGAADVARRSRWALDKAGMASYLVGVADLVLRTVAGAQPDHAGTAEARRRQAFEVVSARLGDPHLAASVVAEAMGISVRRLHQVFAGGPTVAEQIREARVELAKTLLRDPLWAGQPVSAVAHRCGFLGHSQFSRSFRSETGTTPSDYRSAAVQQR